MQFNVQISAMQQRTMVSLLPTDWYLINFADIISYIEMKKTSHYEQKYTKIDTLISIRHDSNNQFLRVITRTVSSVSHQLIWEQYLF